MLTEQNDNEPLSADEFTHLGQGAIAYVKPIRSEEVLALFPQAPAMQPGLDLFLLLGADGVPIMLPEEARRLDEPGTGGK